MDKKNTDKWLSIHQIHQYVSPPYNCAIWFYDVLTVLLEYIDLFNMSDNTKQTFGRGYPVLYHSIYAILHLKHSFVDN